MRLHRRTPALRTAAVDREFTVAIRRARHGRCLPAAAR
jgi:hypothetical protein